MFCYENDIEGGTKITDVPLETVYEFLIKKRLVQDRQSATKLVSQQIGGKTAIPGRMSYEEFNRLFCKGMFKVALVNTINNLQTQTATNPSDDEEPRTEGFFEEMPLSLKIERYQRNRILDGLDPKTDKNKQLEILKVL